MSDPFEFYGCVFTPIDDESVDCDDCGDPAVVRVDVLCNGQVVSWISTCECCAVSDRDLYSVRYRHLMRAADCHAAA